MARVVKQRPLPQYDEKDENYEPGMGMDMDIEMGTDTALGLSLGEEAAEEKSPGLVRRREYRSQEFEFVMKPHRSPPKDVDLTIRPNVWFAFVISLVLIGVVFVMEVEFPSSSKSFSLAYLSIYTFIFLTTMMINAIGTDMIVTKDYSYSLLRELLFPVLILGISCLYFIPLSYSNVMLYLIAERVLITILIVPWCILSNSSRTRVRTMLYSYMPFKDCISATADGKEFSIVRSEKQSKQQALDMLLRDMYFLKSHIRVRKQMKLYFTVVVIIILFGLIVSIFAVNVRNITSFDIFIVLEIQYILSITLQDLLTYNGWITKLESYHFLHTDLKVKILCFSFGFFSLNFGNMVLIIALILVSLIPQI